MGIGQIIKTRRTKAGLSQKELAASTEGAITQAGISRLENGEENVTVGTLREIARALKCAPVELLPPEFHQRQAQPTTSKAA